MSQYRIIKDTSVKPKPKEVAKLKTDIYLKNQEITHLVNRLTVAIRQKKNVSRKYWQRVKHEHKLSNVKTVSEGYHRGTCYKCGTIVEWFV